MRVSDERLAAMCEWIDAGQMLEGMPGVFDSDQDALALDLRDAREELAGLRRVVDAARAFKKQCDFDPPETYKRTGFGDDQILRGLLVAILRAVDESSGWPTEGR